MPGEYHGTEKHDHNHVVTVTENRAVTDKSVELLNEMEQKASENILARIVVEENYLKAKAIVFYQDAMENKLVFLISFTLNGKEYKLEEIASKYDWEHKHALNGRFGNDSIVRAVFKLISEAIAKELMIGATDFMNDITKMR
jgi:hypothetical protein